MIILKNYAYNIRVLPLVKRLEDGSYEDNLTTDEMKNISCEPRMLRRSKGKMFFTLLIASMITIRFILSYFFTFITSQCLMLVHSFYQAWGSLQSPRNPDRTGC